MELDRTERRILGSLIEKKWSTPDQYPMSLKALLAACNQRSNRHPVLELQDFEVEGALLALRERGLAYTVERDGGRVIRFSERLSEDLSLDQSGAAILAELMLRGPQTAPELSRRVVRMGCANSLEAVDEKLRELSRSHFTRLLPQASGQRHARWTHLLCPEDEIPTVEEAAPPAARRSSTKDRIESLQKEVAELRERIEKLEAAAPPSPPPGETLA